MPLGGDNVVAVPFTQSTALPPLPALFSSYPATYTLLPETAIALACVPLGNVVAAPLFNQYAAVRLVLFAAYPATYTSLPETAIALACELVMPLGIDRAVAVAVGLPEASCHTSARVSSAFPTDMEVTAYPAM